MTASSKTRLKVILPVAILLVILTAFIAVAFAPTVRSANATPTDAFDRDAVRVLNNCAAYASSHDFETQMTGSVKAKVFGIPYKITVSGRRTVTDGDLESVAESISAFVKAGVKRLVIDGRLYSATGSYKRKTFTYSEPREYTRDEFISAFGKPDLGLVKYELTGNILTAEKLSDTSYRYTLEPNRAAQFCRNEVKTTLSTDKLPEYELIELTLDVDGDRPVRVAVHERFTVDKFGGTRCDAYYSESFTFKS